MSRVHTIGAHALQCVPKNNNKNTLCWQKKRKQDGKETIRNKNKSNSKCMLRRVPTHRERERRRKRFDWLYCVQSGARSVCMNKQQILGILFICVYTISDSWDQIRFHLLFLRIAAITFVPSLLRFARRLFVSFFIYSRFILLDDKICVMNVRIDANVRRTKPTMNEWMNEKKENFYMIINAVRLQAIK